jgi:hypothetical protein
VFDHMLLVGHKGLNLLEFVADFAKGMDKGRIVRVRFYFAPQSRNKSVNASVTGETIVPPDGI